eukprot:Gb_33424 [translate_table: standard]
MVGYLRRVMVIILLVLVTLFGRGVEGKLSVNFYGRTCPQMESVIRAVMGCDGSVLISSTQTNQAERDAPPNLSLAGDAFDVVVRAKRALEKTCPGVVSCADILAVLARDATVNGPSWPVLKGRRDGRVSSAAYANANLPGSNFHVNQLIKNFASKGLSAMDMVILSGAHTIGNSHCNEVTKRLYEFSPSRPTDPTIEGSFAKVLKQACPAAGGDPNVVQPFDRLTPFKFDNLYYTNLVKRRGLLTSDQVLFSDPRTRTAVVQFASNQTRFFKAFAGAMLKLGNVGVKTGLHGEIRRDCTKFN